MSDPHFQREDRGDRWRRIADEVERRPESLEVALENLDRWERWGRVHPGPLKEWRRRILAAQQSKDEMRKLIRFLEMPNHDSEPLKSCSPFVGLTSLPRSAIPTNHDS
jgi:hypothetical protein